MPHSRRLSRLERVIGFLLAVLLLTLQARAGDHRVALGTGRVPVAAFAATVGRDLNLPSYAFPPGEIDLTGDRASRFARELCDTLAPACTARVDAGSLIVQIDSAKAPKDAASIRRAIRLLSTGDVARPPVQPTAYGLLLPEKFDASRPVIIVIHGLDSDPAIFGSMVTLLQADGWQVGAFRYPDDGPIAESAKLLADCFADARLKHPGLRAEIIAHSMGGLVARDYVEGASYRGGVERLIMLGTPNHGSTWARYRWALEWVEHYQRCGTDDRHWWTRMQEDGNGEASDDLKPGSPYLQELNARKRRVDVRYTIIAGNQNGARNTAAGWLDCTASCIPTRATGWWGFRQTHHALTAEATEMRAVQSSADGPVSIESARLEGVSDMIVVHADHIALCTGAPPAAWPIIRERLK